jgi:hypothetical protein
MRLENQSRLCDAAQSGLSYATLEVDFRIPTVGASCRCLNHSTSMGGNRSKVEGGDRHDLEPEGMHADTKHKIYTGSGSRSSSLRPVWGIKYGAMRLALG